MKKMFVLSLQTPLLLSALLAATQLASAATDTWTGTDNGNWSDANNWTGGNAPPQAGDSLVFGSSATTTTLNNDLTPGTAFDGLTFNGSTFTLNGSSSVLLSGQTERNTIGILNDSSVAQTIGTMPLTLDWGYYTFSSPDGGTVALNGGLTLNTGGVAYFDPNVTTTSLATDGSGLITGLGGAGLMYNPATGFPTGLATTNGTGGIAAYSAFTPYTSGAILTGANNNVLLNASAATAFTVASGVSVNTITANQPGNSGGTATDTVTVTGTLTLGATSGIGGVYALSGGSYANLLTLAAGTGGTITAGPSGVGGTIVLGGVDITTASFAPNVMSVATAITDNNGGPVNVVKVGFSSISCSASANTFSGGLYVDQGQIQAGTSFGTGPVYIAPGATLFINDTTGTPTFNNNFFLSPGTGFAGDLASGTQGALTPGSLILGTDSLSLNSSSGSITLLGAPVTLADATPAAGDRMIGNGTVTYFLNGPIVGTGTLDLCSVPHAGTYSFQNQTGTPNSWSGGLLIETPLTTPSSARTVVVSLGAGSATHTMIPHGAGAGDVMLYSGAASGSFITGSSATLNLNGYNATINGLWGYSAAGVSGNMVVENTTTTSSTLTIGDNNATASYGGVTTDTSAHLLGLTKIGAGTQTFTGVLGYHGNTTVNGGSFALSGSATLANTPVITVAAGATFDATDLGGFTVGAAQTLNCVGTVLGGTTIINGTVEALDPIGTLTVGNSGSMTFNSGGTYVWNINNATGTAGSDPGWSLLNVSGSLNLGSLGASSFTINVTSLDLTDAAGSAANFNSLANYSWPIAYAAGGISGFNNTTPQFNIVTSAFANHPNSSAQWSVSLDGTGDYLLLKYNGFAVLTTPLPVTPLVVNQNDTAIFTVTANSLGTGPSFAWTQNGTPLSNGGTSAGGAPGNVTIATSNGGYTSTLTITGVDAAAYADSGTITVTATETYQSALQTGISSETLTVIDAPYDPNVAESAIAVPVSAGAVNILTASASGTQPFTYQWYLNGNEINGATSSNLDVNISPSTAGSYTVVIGNAAGGVTSSTTVITPVSTVPNQLLFEPFNYPDQQRNANPPQPAWDAFGVTNLYNQATGAGVAWLNIGNNDFSTLPNTLDDPYTISPYGVGTRPIINNQYPVAGLAGDDVSAIYADSDVNGGQVNLPFGTSITSGEVYCSFVIQLWGMNQTPSNYYDYLCGFNSGANSSTTHSVGLYIEENTAATFPNVPYTLGVFKGNITTSGLSPGVNGDWSPNTFLDYNVLFVVWRINFNNSPATCDLWINPSASSYYANEANLPTPDVANAASGAADVAGGVSSFYMKITQYPVDRLFSDVRVGTTWASVTPPSAPTLALANQVLTNPVSSTVVFASQNAGNPVNPGVGPYQWQFNGVPIPSDGPSGHGPSGYSGSATATLTITNATTADLGTYTVTGSNTSPAPSDNSATLTGGASALLTATRPALSISSIPPNVLVSWPTNWAAALEATTSLAPPVTWTPVVGGESSFLYWPPGSGALAWAPTSLTISGTNYTVTVAPESSSEMFFRLTPSP